MKDVFELVHKMGPLTMATKPDVFALARSGNRAAFEQLVADHEALVLRTAWRLLGRREDAQDAAQEVFLRLYKGIGKLAEESIVEAWLYRVTVNVCQDLRRKRGIVAPDTIERGCPSTIERDLEFDQQKAAVVALLVELPDKERAALVLRELEGLPTRRVAEILGSSEVTVRSQVASARAKLKAWVVAKGKCRDER